MSSSTAPSEPKDTLHDRLLELEASLKGTKRKENERSVSSRFSQLAPLVLDRTTKRPRRTTVGDGSQEADETAEADSKAKSKEDESSLEYFKTMLEDIRKQEERQTKHHQATVQKIKDIRAVYLYALERVSGLQDLRTAPDAILPGNFVTTRDSDKSG